MEKVALSNEQLDYLASKHPALHRVYGGAVPSDGLPRRLRTDFPQAFIVNTDPTGQPGMHWMAIWIEENRCEVFDSFALPLQTYPGVEPFIRWLERHCKNIETNDRSVQSVTSDTCGVYALFYLMLKSEGGSMSQFLSMFKLHDYIANDRVVGEMLKQLIQKDSQWKSVCKKPFAQCNRVWSKRNKRM